MNCRQRENQSGTRHSRRIFGDECELPNPEDNNKNDVQPLTPTVTLPIRTFKTEQFTCIVCSCNDMNQLRQQPDGFTGSWYRRERIYIPRDSLVCRRHMEGNGFSEADEEVLLKKMVLASTHVITINETDNHFDCNLKCSLLMQMTNMDIVRLLQELSSSNLVGICLIDFGLTENVPAEAYEKLVGVTRERERLRVLMTGMQGCSESS